jgi:hypothetical protein
MSLTSLILSAVVGGVVGAVVALVLALLRLDPEQRKQISVAAVVMSIVAANTLVPQTLRERLADRVEGLFDTTPSQKAQRRLVRLLREMPGLFEYVQAQAGGPGASAERVRQVAFRMTAQGVGRLDDDGLAARSEFTGKVLEKADLRVCAAIVRGTATQPDFMAVLDRMAPDELEAWIEITYAAAKAELQKSIPNKADQEIVERLFKEEVGKDLPSAERLRLLEDIINIRKVQDSEACWAGRTLYKYARTMKPPYSTHLNRLLASNE